MGAPLLRSRNHCLPRRKRKMVTAATALRAVIMLPTTQHKATARPTRWTRQLMAPRIMLQKTTRMPWRTWIWTKLEISHHHKLIQKNRECLDRSATKTTAVLWSSNTHNNLSRSFENVDHLALDIRHLSMCYLLFAICCLLLFAIC